MSAPVPVALLGALLGIVLDHEPVHRPDEWPDDAVLGMLELFAEMQPLGPMLEHNSPASGAVGKPMYQASKRTLQEARPTLFRIYWRLPSAPRLGDFEEQRRPVYRLPPLLARALARIEVATHEWERLEETYAPRLDSVCGMSRTGPRYQPLEKVLAIAVSSALVLDPGGLELLRGPAWRASPCHRRHLASSLNAHLAHPTAADRELLRALLAEPDEDTQTAALRSLLRDLTPEERRAIASAYLQSSTRVGTGAEAFARRVLDGTLKDEDLVTQEQREEDMARRWAADKARRAAEKAAPP